MPTKLVGQQPIRLICNVSGSCPREPILAESTSVAVAGHAYAGLVGLRLPRWAPRGYFTNCSAVYSPPVVISGEMPLADCLVACLRDTKCDAVTVDWVVLTAAVVGFGLATMAVV